MPEENNTPASMDPEKLASTAAETTAEPPPKATTAPPPPTPSAPQPSDIQVNWEQGLITINKTFYKISSFRLFYRPLSLDKSIAKAERQANAKGYHIPSNPMILGTAALFFGHLLVEVENANPKDSHIISLQNKEFHTRLITRPLPQLKIDIDLIKKDLGKEPEELYLYHANDKKILLAR